MAGIQMPSWRVLLLLVCVSQIAVVVSLPSPVLDEGSVHSRTIRNGAMHIRGGNKAKLSKSELKQSVTLFSMTTKPQEGYARTALKAKLGMLDLGPKALGRLHPATTLAKLALESLVLPFFSSRLLNHSLVRFMLWNFLEQATAVLPVCIFLAGFQALVLRLDIEDGQGIAGGLVLVMFGLALFNFGLLYGLMPIGKTLGKGLPATLSMNWLLVVTGLLGVAVTLAEPALSVVKTAGSLIQEKQAPYLFALLHHRQELLVLAVAVGVGISASFGMLRIRQSWSIKPVAILLSMFTLLLSAYVNWFTERQDLIGLAWDLGAVTTGPVTVPLVIALGVGVASCTGATPSPLTGFGVVTLASLIPVNTVLILGLTLPKFVASTAKKVAKTTAIPSMIRWQDKTPFLETQQGLQALVPLVMLMYGLLRGLLRDDGDVSTTVKIDQHEVVAPATLALCAAQVGIIMFNVGLNKGLAKLGTVVGGVMPAAFTSMSNVKSAPIWDRRVGVWVALIFSWFLGVGATLAEPALSTLAVTVEKLSGGDMKKSTVVFSVALGVGTGIALGVLKVVVGLPLLPLLLVGYSIAIALTIPSSEVLANVAWDSAGVTTGPITVPLVISLGLGLGNALGISDGFGILSLASVCPIISVLAVGLLTGGGKKDY